AGAKYEHGGISPQESIVPVLSVRRATAEAPTSLTELRWVQLRVRVHAEDAPAGSLLDIRSRPADANSSLLGKPILIGDDGTASAVIEDDSRLGESAAVVVISADRTRILAQRATIVGGDT